MSGGKGLQTLLLAMAVLTIQSDDVGTQYLLNNLITIIRPNENTDYQIINSLFQPFGNTNTIEYLGTYFEYASAINSIENYGIITLNPDTNVQKGQVYNFTGTAIKQTQRNCPDTQFGLANVRENSMVNVVCGYGENLSINNNNEPITANNIISLAYNTTIFFTPTTKLYIFTSQGLQPNMIIPSSYLNPSSRITPPPPSIIIGNYLEVDMNESQTIHFNSKTNQFEIGELLSSKK